MLRRYGAPICSGADATKRRSRPRRIADHPHLNVFVSAAFVLGLPVCGPQRVLSSGDTDRPRLAINVARFLSAFVQLRPAFAARLKARRLIARLMRPVPLPPRGRNHAARETRGTAMKAERFDIHQHITDQIIGAIEQGAGEFRLPS